MMRITMKKLRFGMARVFVCRGITKLVAEIKGLLLPGASRARAIAR